MSNKQFSLLTLKLRAGYVFSSFILYARVYSASQLHSLVTTFVKAEQVTVDRQSLTYVLGISPPSLCDGSHTYL